MDPSSNKREMVRVEINSDVDYSFDNKEWFLGRIRNISKSGVFISVIDNLTVYHKIHLKFVLPDTKWKTALRITGKVVRTTPSNTDKNPTGLGIHFLTVMAESEEILTDFIRRIISDESLVEKIDRQEASGKASYSLDLEKIALSAEMDIEEDKIISFQKAETAKKRDKMVKRAGMFIYGFWKYLFWALIAYVAWHFIRLFLNKFGGDV